MLILKIDLNVPIECALKFAGPGREVESRFGGVQHMFTVTTAECEHLLYTNTELAQQIEGLKLAAGERFVIQKRVAPEGERWGTRWFVTRPEAKSGARAADSALQLTQQEVEILDAALHMLDAVRAERDAQERDRMIGVTGQWLTTLQIRLTAILAQEGR
jgi:hypothetical protein